MAPADEAQQIQAQMAAIRSELRGDVDNIFASARTLSDWRYYVQAYPWATLAGAMFLGYMVVPQRIEIMRPDPAALEMLARRNRLVVRPQAEGAERRQGTMDKLFHLAASLAVRGLLAYAGQKLGKMVGHKAAEEEQTPPPFAPKPR